MNNKKLHAAARRGLQSSGEIVQELLARLSPDSQRTFAAEVASGTTFTVRYGGIPTAPFIALETRDRAGRVREIFRKELA